MYCKTNNTIAVSLGQFMSGHLHIYFVAHVSDVVPR